MKTVDKALGLLKHFCPETPEWGLSDLARAAQLNKATALRMLQVLTRHGLLEQDSGTRHFRLGVALLNLAKTREATFPLSSIVQPVLDRLVLETNETAHAAIASSTGLTVIGVVEPQRSTRAYVNPSQELPFHATASGIVYLAYSNPSRLDALLDTGRFEAYASKTPTSPAAVLRMVNFARNNGFAIADKTFDDEVIGVAAPIFDKAGQAQGAIAVAMPSHRRAVGKQVETHSQVVQGAFEVTHGIGAEPDTGYLETVRGIGGIRHLQP